VERAGQALVNAERLLAVVREMTSDPVSLEASEGQLVVRGGKAVFKPIAMKPSNFPPFPAALDVEPFTVGAETLRRMVVQTAFAASRENSQYARAAVLFRAGEGTLTLAATDTRRLSEARCRIESEAEAMIPDFTVKMPPDAGRRRGGHRGVGEWPSDRPFIAAHALAIPKNMRALIAPDFHPRSCCPRYRWPPPN
jgi:DNA polymerase III sliding clamp (beta) subunit (PCNA family)